MSEELKEILVFDFETQGERIEINEYERNKIKDYIINLLQENKQLKSQLEYLRSGEYINQLKFERNMLQDLVDNGEISKEDKKFIDCTHRNTELLEELEEEKRINVEDLKTIDRQQEIIQELKDNWNKLKEYLKDYNSLSHLFENDYNWEDCMNKITNKMQELEKGE